MLFYNTCLNPFNIYLFSGEIIISAASLKFSSQMSFGFTILSAILFPINSSIASAALWTTFLEAGFTVSSPVLAAVSNNIFLYLFDKFLDKNSYPLQHFLDVGPI